MLAASARFADDAAAVEKTLRLIQGFCTTIIGLTASAELAVPWKQARNQLALGTKAILSCAFKPLIRFSLEGRRYFRLLKWHSCWDIAYQAFQRDEGGLTKLLEVGNWSFLGLYYFLEMPTIVSFQSKS